MAAPDAGLQVLGTVDGVEFAIGNTPEPWRLPIDMLMISAGQSGGLGALGGALEVSMPGLGWGRLDYGALRPERPIVLTVSDHDRGRAGSALRQVVVATTRDLDRESGFELPASVGAAATAAAAAIRLAAANDAPALGLPMLGAEAAGLPVEEVAAAVVPLAVETATGSRSGSLQHVVFVCRDDRTEKAIRSAWDRVPGPLAGERLERLPSAEQLLGDAAAVAAARRAPHVTGLDVLLAVLTAAQPRTVVARSLRRAIPDDQDRRIGDAAAAARVGGPSTGSGRPGRDGLVAAGERIARAVGGGEVGVQHLLAAAVGGLLPEPEIPKPVLAALGVTQRRLRDVLRSAIAREMPGESAEAWAEVWAEGERALRRATPSVRRYADVHNDAESTEDRLGITADVDAMAALLAATSTTPPLSVALMGNWGSGKSTFMALVQRRVAVLSAAAAADPESRFAPVIRQVRFNAWHYSDDHVWVGLIEHLFRGLREAAPATGDDAVPELEAKLKAAQSRQAKLDDELVRIDELDPDQGWWGWLWEPRRFALVLRAAGLQAVRGAPWRRVLVGLLWLVAVAAVVAGVAYGWQWASGLAVVSAALALLAPVVSAWRRARELAAAAHTKLVEDKKQVAAEIVRLERKLDAADPVRGLKALVEELNTGDRYRSYRGLTGQIHEDLRRLDQQMGGLGQRERQRIVLYVDDLDRCTSTRVVEVLQAVNLLLSMPLFVVVVAVDPRWLITAIEERHGKDARPLDYLDKIFHIPFAVRPMHDRAGAYLTSLLPPVEVDEEPDLAEPDAERVAPEPLTAPEVRPAPQPAPVVPERTVARAEERLRIRAAEAAFLPEVAVLLETPRAVKKAVNLYLLLRATVADADLDDFLGDERGGPFQAAALLVAGVVGDPARAEELLSRVIAAKPDDPVGPVLPVGPLSVRVDGFAQRFPLLEDAGPYQRWARTVARYSFQSYALFGDAASPSASPASA